MTVENSTEPAGVTNASLGRVLGLHPTSISRMRSGGRYGSHQTLLKVAETSGTNLETVFAAVAKGRAGDLTEWHGLLDRAARSGEPATA